MTEAPRYAEHPAERLGIDIDVGRQLLVSLPQDRNNAQVNVRIYEAFDDRVVIHSVERLLQIEAGTPKLQAPLVTLLRDKPLAMHDVTAAVIWSESSLLWRLIVI